MGNKLTKSFQLPSTQLFIFLHSCTTRSIIGIPRLLKYIQ